MKRFAKIINQKTKEVVVGADERPDLLVQERWRNWGLEPLDVEQGCDERWYVNGFAPQAPVATEITVRQQRASAYAEQTDAVTLEYMRKNILGQLTLSQKSELENKLRQLSVQIQNRYPYAQVNEKQNKEVA